jgi:hypothetical protein
MSNCKLQKQISLALALIVVMAFAQMRPQTLVAQQPRLPVSKLAADMVRVHRGPTLYGAIVNRDDAGNVTFAVHREWLKKTHREYHDLVVERDAAFIKSNSGRLLKRVETWREHRKEDVGMRVFLDKEKKRLTELLEEKTSPKGAAARGGPLLSVEILADEIKTAYAQPLERRRLLRAAWKHNVHNAVTRTPLALSRELEKLEVDWRNATSGPSVASATADSEQQWATRMALVEFRLRKPLRFQGAGSFLARTGAGADDVAMKEVMGRVLKDQLTEQLNALLGRGKPKDDGKWLEQAIREAEKEDVLGFRVARLDKDVAKGTATVEVSFFAKMPSGEWASVFQTRATKSAADVKKESLEEVAGADEVKNILGLLKGTGLPLGDDAMKRALGFGAATKEAMNQAHLQFVTFLNPYTKRVDSPAIRSTR